MTKKVHFDIELSKKLCPPKDPTDRSGKKKWKVHKTHHYKKRPSVLR